MSKLLSLSGGQTSDCEFSGAEGRPGERSPVHPTGDPAHGDISWEAAPFSPAGAGMK